MLCKPQPPILVHKQLAIVALLLCASPALAGEADYERDIRPLLAEKCSACHGAIKQEAGLRLDAGSLIRQGSGEGPVIDIASPSASHLIERVASKDIDLRMPPEGEGEPLNEQQIALLTAWIASGAKSPADEAIPAGPEEHWSYQPPLKAAIPEVDDPAWATNPIDAFIYAKLRERGAQPLPMASRETLVRRAYLDLIGLPPTAEELRYFVNDDSPDAWPRLVDRLLDDPAHGERWARHWMDVWRYSDWDGYKNELRSSQRHIWHWRDWIIESLNDDKPYDRMIVEMLAADEAAPEDRDALRATGYLARSYHKSNRNIWLDATVEHTAKAFMGMTINCARCHDHKYDPIGQQDYYALRAVFEPHHVRTERLPGQADTANDGLVRAYDAKPDEPTYLYIGGNEKKPDKEHPLAPAVPAIIGLDYQPAEVDLPPVAVFPALNEFIAEEDLAKSQAKVNEAHKQLEQLDPANADSLATEIVRQKVIAAQAGHDSLKARWEADRAKYRRELPADEITKLAHAAATAERSAAVGNAKLTVANGKQAVAAAEASDEADAGKKEAAINKAREELAKAEQALAEAEKKATATDANYTSVGKSYPGRSTGRRLALARVITDRNNPFTARVAVNHIWLRHFGEPLVDNVFDFGMRADKPEHAELLDWLAVELMENDWSMKHLHRLIVSSRLYCIASAGDPVVVASNEKLDPDNRLLWRAKARRLDAEAVRDSVLHVAGSLDRKLGGPDLDFNAGATVPRRSIYFRHAYEKQMRMLVTFDAASPNECYRRSESIVPGQALALFNGRTAIEAARKAAARLSSEAKDDDAFIRSAFETILSRDCTTEEFAACSEFLASQTEQLADAAKLTPVTSKTKAATAANADPAQRARENLVHVLLNHNDFVTIR